MSVEIPEYGGCVWPVDPACLSDAWASMDTFVQDRALRLATSTLERLTGRRVGHCPITVRPLPQRGNCYLPGMSLAETTLPFTPNLGIDGFWRNSCYTYDSCTISLPAPIGRVDQVKVNGVVVPAGDYRVVERRMIAYIGVGTCPWLYDQDPYAPDTEVGTMSITYLNAYPVDSVGAHAAGLLAMEFAKACTGAKGCRLPKNVTSVVRQGITFDIAAGLFPEGKTGIDEVDAYIMLWNPKNQIPSQVWSPDSQTVSW